MPFQVNHPILFGLAALVILFVLFQSIFFLRKAWKHALELGLSSQKLREMSISTAVFTIAPAVAILIGLITLSKFLGLPLPWLRLSVLGALTYELPAATAAAEAMHTPINHGLAGWIPVFVLLFSAMLMLICGLFVKIFKWRWLENYAMPISMLGAMAFAIPLTAWIG